MQRDELIKKIRGRVEMCRRLANSTTDERTAETLRQMADEGEADMKRLLAENPADLG
jgi:hypothetical protein